jgi:hypothetical protein
MLVSGLISVLHLPGLVFITPSILVCTCVGAVLPELVQQVTIGAVDLEQHQQHSSVDLGASTGPPWLIHSQLPLHLGKHSQVWNLCLRKMTCPKP